MNPDKILRSNHLVPGQFAGISSTPEEGGGLGLGFGVRMEAGRSAFPFAVENAKFQQPNRFIFATRISVQQMKRGRPKAFPFFL